MPTTEADWSTVVAAARVAGANIMVLSVTSPANANAAVLAAGYNTTQMFATQAAATSASSGANLVGYTGETFGDQDSLNLTPAGTAFINKVSPLLSACTICLNGAKVFLVTQADYYDYSSIYFIATAAHSVLASGQQLTRANIVTALHQIQLPNDPDGYPQAFDANGAMQGPPLYIDRATTFNSGNGTYTGQIVAKYTFGASLPVYNITASASGG